MKVKLTNFYCETTKLQDSEKETWNQIFRSGDWSNSYKQFKVKKADLQEFVKNFDNNILGLKGKELQVNYSHESWKEAAGWITDIRVKGRFLEAKIRWTPKAIQKIEDEEFKYFSAELAFEYVNEETEEVTKNVLLGAALTNIPFVRGLKTAALDDGENGNKNKFLSFNLFKQMDAFKKMLSTLQEKTPSLAEVELLKSQMEFLSDEDKEEVKEDVEKVGEAAKEGEEADKKEEKVEEKKKEEELSKLKKQVELSTSTESETVKKLSVELSEAKELQATSNSKLDKLSLQIRRDGVEKEVSALVKLGKILPKEKEATIGFAMDLSEAKAKTYLELQSSRAVVVDLDSEVGHGGAPDNSEVGKANLCEEKAQLLLKEAKAAGEKLSHKEATRQARKELKL